MSANKVKLPPELSLRNRMEVRHLGDAIKSTRESQGLEYEELARRLCIAPYLLYKIESGEYELDTGELEEIANSLRCNLRITLTPYSESA